MSIKVTPTKSNLIKTKESLKLATVGHDLLEQKKEVLMIEFMAHVHELKRISSDVYSKLRDIRQRMKKGISLSGVQRFQELISNREIKLEMNVIEKSIMGVNIPMIHLDYEASDDPLSLVFSNSYINKSANEMNNLLPLLIKWIEVYTAIKRLAEEIKKNNRRVNALSNIFIPDYQKTIKHINDILDEQEKEQFSRLKKVKSKIKNKKQGDPS